MPTSITARWGLAQWGQAGFGGGQSVATRNIAIVLSSQWGGARWGGPFAMGGGFSPPPAPPGSFLRVDQVVIETQLVVPPALAPVHVDQVVIEIHVSLSPASGTGSTGRWFPELVGDDFDIGAGEI